MAKLIHEVKDLDGVVSLEQISKNKFTVTYGCQVKSHMTYEQAATEYGECIMHSAACRGLLD